MWSPPVLHGAPVSVGVRLALPRRCSPRRGAAGLPRPRWTEPGRGFVQGRAGAAPLYGARISVCAYRASLAMLLSDHRAPGLQRPVLGQGERHRPVGAASPMPGDAVAARHCRPVPQLGPSTRLSGQFSGSLAAEWPLGSPVFCRVFS